MAKRKEKESTKAEAKPNTLPAKNEKDEGRS